MKKISVATIKIRRGLEADRLSFIPGEGELVLAVDTRKLWAGDGVTAGGNVIGNSCYVRETTADMLATKPSMAGDQVLNRETGHLYVYLSGSPAIITNWYDTNTVSASDVGLDLVKNYDITDAINVNRSDLYASAKAIYLTNVEIQSAETRANAYSDQLSAKLLGTAPTEALDTLRELGDRLVNNGDAISSILAQISSVDSLGKEALAAHMNDTTNSHHVTQDQVGLSHVENKSVAEILADAALTGIVTAPTVGVNDNTSNVATTAWFAQEVLALGLIGIGDTIDGGGFESV